MQLVDFIDTGTTDERKNRSEVSNLSSLNFKQFSSKSAAVSVLADGEVDLAEINPEVLLDPANKSTPGYRLWMNGRYSGPIGVGRTSLVIP